MVRKNVINISDWSRNNQTNIVLCNASLHQLSTTRAPTMPLGSTFRGGDTFGEKKE